MFYKRLLVPVVASLCLVIGTVDAQDQAVIEESSVASSILEHVTPEYLGVCGPIHEALFKLGQKNDDGSFDSESMQFENEPAGSTGVFLPPPPGIDTDSLGLPLEMVKIIEFKGRVQAVFLCWEGNTEEKDFVVETLLSRLTESKGPPQTRNGLHEWYDGDFRTVVSRGEPDMWSTLFYSCRPTEEDFASARRSAVAKAEEPAETSVADGGSLGHNPWLDRSIVSVLKTEGHPTTPPQVVGDHLVVLHFFDEQGPGGVPTEFLWWFLDGKAIYVSGDFLPPKGANRARRSFDGFKDLLRETFGAPLEEIVDPSSGVRRALYTNGPQQIVLSFLDPEGDPWFRLEIYDPQQLDKLDPELRPARTIPKRFTPPRSNSGLTREDFRTEVGAG